MSKHKKIRPKTKVIHKPGLLYSPLVEGLFSLVPIVLFTVVGALSMFPTKHDRFKEVALTLDRQNQSDLIALSLEATKIGDYELAQGVYRDAQKNNSTQVLGANTKVEELIFPQTFMEVEIKKLEDFVHLLPSRSAYQRLAILYWKINDLQKAQSYSDLANRLDPNDSSNLIVKTLVKP